MRSGSGASDGWSEDTKAQFFVALATSANISEAARTVGKTSRQAHDLRARDADFAHRWMVALEQGYTELEMLLLRHALHGHERVETVEEVRDPDELDEGKGALRRIKTVHMHDHGMAMRLMAAHRKTVEAYRRSQGMNDEGREALRLELLARIDRMRTALRTSEDDDDAGR